MKGEIKYSVCTTTYNTVDTVEKAVEPLLALPEEYEVIVVDSKSTDGTYERLKKYEPCIRLISEKCTRGRGRDIAIRNAKGRYIVAIDFDVAYYDIEEVVTKYIDLLESKIVVVNPETHSCNAPIVLGSTELFLRIDSYPDINAFEDLYICQVASSFGILVTEIHNFRHTCIEVRGESSNKESRYEYSLIAKIRRRIFIARDSLFASPRSFSAYTQSLKLFGVRKITIGLPLYVIAMALQPTIKVEKVEDRVHRINIRGL